MQSLVNCHPDLLSFLIVGVPDGQGRRAMAWRVLLNYLPENRETWSDYLYKQRCTYNQFVGKEYFWLGHLPVE